MQNLLENIHLYNVVQLYYLMKNMLFFVFFLKAIPKRMGETTEEHVP